MTEEKRLAIVFSKNQCSQRPSFHRTYRDKNGKPLKMRIVMLPSEIYRPEINFGIDSHGINRNDRMAYLNVPWDMIKHDKTNENKRYFYLNRENYNIQFKGRIKSNGQIEKIDCFNVTAEELENIFNWCRRRENKKVITERLESIKRNEQLSEDTSTISVEKKKKRNKGR